MPHTAILHEAPSRPGTQSRAAHIAPLAQGLSFAAIGLWPLLHLKSFEAVTGPKADDWLVRTMGAMIAAVGGTLVVGALERSTSKALRVLGIGSALVLGVADVVYASKGRISRIYLADAVAQAGVLTGWAFDARRSR